MDCLGDFKVDDKMKYVKKKEIMSELKDYLSNWRTGVKDAFDRMFVIEYPKGKTIRIHDYWYEGEKIDWKNIQSISLSDAYKRIKWVKK